MAAIGRLYAAMDRLSSAVAKLLQAIAGLLIALCTAALLFQVLYRFVIVKFVSFSFPFTEEFARFALIWSAYLCLGICLKEGSQASVNFVYDRLGQKPKLWLYSLTRLLMSVFLIVALVYGVIVTKNNMIFKSATLRVPGLYLYSAPVLGCLLMTYEMITEWLGVLCGKLKPFEAGVNRPKDVGEDQIG